MTRRQWERAKRQGRFAYVAWRAVPLAAVLLVVAVFFFTGGNRFVPLLLVLGAIFAPVRFGRVYDLSRDVYDA